MINNKMKTGQIAAVERVKRARSTYNHKFRKKNIY